MIGQNCMYVCWHLLANYLQNDGTKVMILCESSKKLTGKLLFLRLLLLLY